MADHQATPEDKLRALRARLNVAPRDHMLPDRMTAAIQIADIRFLVNFIDAALFEKDGQEAFGVFAARAVGNFGALVDELRSELTMVRKSHGELVAAMGPMLPALDLLYEIGKDLGVAGKLPGYPRIMASARGAIQKAKEVKS